ncbi:MAG TPA: AbrB/MazE/SpoVT family DNA-binding domain-containing protein [Thioalkalivibrio sp.]|nr:AbrB/MazE/SpoVT family DNA-binding domain-containing protein [Thioalkalivibrio sp.]
MLATLTSKGQVTLPKALRERLHLRTGDKVEFLVHEDGRVELLPVTAPVTRLKGMVPRPERVISMDEMEAAIHRRARDQR